MTKRKHPYRPSKGRISRPRAKPSPAGRPRKRAAEAPYWIYGLHAVTAALANAERACHRILVNASAGTDVETAVAAARDAVPGRPEVERADRAELETVLGADAVHQGAALLAGPLKGLSVDDVIAGVAGAEDAAVVVLDQATDPRNVGAVLRSAAAFDAAAVVVQDRHAPAMTGVVCKAASGAAERVPMVRAVNLARALWALKDAGFWVVGLDPAAETPLAGAKLEGRVAIAIGAEGRGLRRLTRETCDALARVPIADGTDSLNLSNAAAVALYELRRGG